MLVASGIIAVALRSRAVTRRASVHGHRR